MSRKIWSGEWNGIKIKPIECYIPLWYFFMIACWPVFTKYALFFVGALNLGMYFLHVLRKGKIARPNLFEGIYILFVLLCIVQSIYSVSPNTVSLCRRMILYSLGGFSAVRLMDLYNRDPDIILAGIMNSLISGTVFVTLFCILTEGFNIGRLGTETYSNAGGNYIELSICIMFSLLYVIWKIFFRINKKSNKYELLAYIGLLIFLLVACALSNTRKVFVAALLMFGFCIVWKSKLNLIKLLKYILLVVIIAVASYLLIFNIQFLREMFVEKVFGRFVELVVFMQSGRRTDDYSASARSLLRSLAIEIWRQHKLFGVGTDAFRVYNDLGFKISGLYSHCNYTELLCNNGLIGFCLYYSFFVISFLRIMKNKYRYRDIKGFILGALLILLAMDYGQVSYYYLYYIAYYALLSCLLKKCIK